MSKPGQRQQFGYNQMGQKIPGYLAPDPLETITVPDSINDVGGGGSSTYLTVEARLQLTVQQLVGGFATQGLSDADVSDLLQGRADDAAAWNGGLDPSANNTPALVAFYVKVFRAAVTPIQ